MNVRFSIPVCWLFLLLGHLAVAQNATKRADQQFAQLAYAPAAELYEQAIKEVQLPTEAEVRQVRAKLGYCYRQLRDTKNAERVYRELIGQGELPPDYADAYLHFAQALASNGKYKEAQEAYETYGTLQGADSRAPRFSKLYRDVSALTENAGSYRVDFLDLNTRQPEFSPAYYREGLVFVTSSKTENGVRRVFKWDNTPFLDLYFLPERSTVKGSQPTDISAGKANRRQLRAQSYRPLGRDDFTASTANDSRTPGVFGGSQMAAGEGYGMVPVSESEQFSQSLNSKYHEGPATFSADGTRVIFTRNNYNNGQSAASKDGVNKLKLYTARQVNGIWVDIEEMPFNNDEYSTGHPALSRDNQRLYFASDMPGGFGGTDIYVSKWEGTRWSAPVNMGAEVNSKGNELFPFVDEKGNLYLASDGLPGLGDLDMFYVELTPDGKATKNIRNLGEPLNSAKDDFGIVTDGDRKSGYFSSNRKNGGSDDDIYRFSREGSLYPCRQLTVNVFDEVTKAPLPNTLLVLQGGEPGNDRKELQTDANGDVRICVDAESELTLLAMHTGYISSKIGFATHNLQDDQPSRLEIALSHPTPAPVVAPAVATAGAVTGVVVQQQGKVVRQRDKAPVSEAKIRLENECDGSSWTMVSDGNGLYSFTTILGCEYKLEATVDNMVTIGSRIAADGTGTPDLTMLMAGDILTIDNIYYDRGKSKIRRDAALELDRVVYMLKRYPGITIEMRSHTDSRSKAMYNKTLSTNRAKAAVAYLASKGVTLNRMKAMGYGESVLVNGCKDGVNCTEKQHQQNRRTEVKILTVE
ncbi:OmpA family protein [Fibrivirga algicola]|uniref:OmpA family protein n=1 Tax=Fibrivirga algicola TaxID=2950420 RepID=A0ABX0QKY7_9BACT|nr:OmpA family protein [Fibrivirga algicola]NID12807.1 OmpA family protein [Fibrivirga algicola]